jgi:hypothetical protein
MLYQDKTLGRTGLGARLLAQVAMAFSRRRHQDLDLLAMSAHLRRDIGMGDVAPDIPFPAVWRK